MTKPHSGSPLFRRILSLVLLSTTLSLFGTAVVASGQDRGQARPEVQAPTAGTKGTTVKGAQSEEREEVTGKVKVFKFSGLDISGRLKSPQLLYFLNRLRAEFDRPRLPHRSFMPELVRSSKGKAF
jgi:hypothetical protein